MEQQPRFNGMGKGITVVYCNIIALSYIIEAFSCTTGPIDLLGLLEN